METYKQDIKERTRELLWNHAVRNLTHGRMDSRVLNPSYLDNLWDFVKKNFEKAGIMIHRTSMIRDMRIGKDMVSASMAQKDLKN